MIELSPATAQRVRALFRDAEVVEAERLLAHECAGDLPLSGAATPSSLERVRFAALRVSGGDVARLREAIQLARADWRDLLVAAEFAGHERAHESWRPQRFDARVVEQWLKGAPLPGVAFARKAAVVIAEGPYKLQAGIAIGLVGLEPEPRYRVKLASGKQTDVPQRLLTRAD